MKYKKTLNILIWSIPVIILIVPYYFKWLYYPISDDYIFNFISVGAYGGGPNEYIPIVSIVMGRILKILYVLNSNINWYAIILLGLLFGSGISQVLLNIGIYAFIAVVAFQVITLPVELDASHRALKILKQNRLLNDKEIKMARKVLTAAAMTYVAAVATALFQLLRLVILFGGNRRRN